MRGLPRRSRRGRTPREVPSLRLRWWGGRWDATLWWRTSMHCRCSSHRLASFGSSCPTRSAAPRGTTLLPWSARSQPPCLTARPPPATSRPVSARFARPPRLATGQAPTPPGRAQLSFDDDLLRDNLRALLASIEGHRLSARGSSPPTAHALRASSTTPRRLYSWCRRRQHPGQGDTTEPGRPASLAPRKVAVPLLTVSKKYGISSSDCRRDWEKLLRVLPRPRARPTTRGAGRTAPRSLRFHRSSRHRSQVPPASRPRSSHSAPSVESRCV